MTDPTPNRPLWQVMADAYHGTVHDFDNVPHAYAAELRAITARIKERHPRANVVAAELLAEANRADAGGTTAAPTPCAATSSTTT